MRDCIGGSPIMLFRRTPEAVHDSIVMKHVRARANVKVDLHGYTLSMIPPDDSSEVREI